MPLSVKYYVISLLAWIEAPYMLRGGDWMLVFCRAVVIGLHVLVIWWCLLLVTLRYLLRSMLVDVESLRKGVLYFNPGFFLTGILLCGALLLLVELRFARDRFRLPLDRAPSSPLVPLIFTIFSTVILLDVLVIIDVIRKAM